MYKFSNGNIYEGFWKNNKMHGKGLLTQADKTRIEGLWENGKMHGLAVVTHAEGTR